MLLDSRDSVASLIDHTILHPTATLDDIRKDLHGVRGLPLASVCIKPQALSVARQVLDGTRIPLCTVAGFPHGTSRTEVKAQEARLAIEDGASEVDMVVNVGLALGGNWCDVRSDIQAVQDVCLAGHALLKVIFETDYLTREEDKVHLCEICTEIGVAFVKTSTGFGFVKTPEGFLARGAQVADLQLMRRHCPASIGVKASGGIRTLDDLLRCVEAGANRIGASATKAILSEAEARFGK